MKSLKRLELAIDGSSCLMLPEARLRGFEYCFCPFFLSSSFIILKSFLSINISPLIENFLGNEVSSIDIGRDFTVLTLVVTSSPIYPSPRVVAFK